MSSFDRVWTATSKAQEQLPTEVRQQLVDGIYRGEPFRAVLNELGLTSNQVWGLIKSDQQWSEKLEAALTASRREDLQHGTNAAYVAGCVCGECREHQRVRMAKNRSTVGRTGHEAVRVTANNADEGRESTAKAGAIF